jgi:selenocysteine lyase/cysteine desulfurase
VGLGVAVQYCLDQQVTRYWPRIQSLAALLRYLLAEELGAQVHDHGGQLCGIVSFTIPGLDPDEVMTRLAVRGSSTTTVTPVRGSSTTTVSSPGTSTLIPGGVCDDQQREEAANLGAKAWESPGPEVGKEQQQQQLLRRRSIAVSVSGVASTRLDYEARGLPPATLRASAHYYNSVGDLEEFAAAIQELILAGPSI